MYLAKMLTAFSYPEIGRQFGGRDHTTVMHAVRTIEGLIASDKGIAEDVQLLRSLLSNRPKYPAQNQPLTGTPHALPEPSAVSIF